MSRTFHHGKRNNKEQHIRARLLLLKLDMGDRTRSLVAAKASLELLLILRLVLRQLHKRK